MENNNNTFNYTWNDGTNTYTFVVTIPYGKYDIFALNKAFETAQINNKTYLISTSGAKKILMSFTYDTVKQKIILIVENLTASSSYTKPIISDGSPYNWLFTNTITPTVVISNNKFADLIGFTPGSYSSGITTANLNSLILPSYVPLHYKPNNPTFGVQGAVDSSSRIQRIKYNTITNGAALIKSAYGNAAANALAYGVSENAYTAKTAVGDKPKLTPIIDAKTGKMCKKIYIYRR
jgi:hypothetical protein